MHIHIHEFLARCGLTEKLYPGKRHVQKLPKPGEHRSHCVEYDWRDPGVLHMEVKAGLSGRTLPVKDLKKYPVSFQSRTYVEFALARSGHAEAVAGIPQDGEAETEGKTGDGGGQAPRRRAHAFSDLVKGSVPDAAQVRRLVLMGKEIAQAAMPAVLDSLAAQIHSLSVAPVNLLAAVSRVTRVAPGGFGHVAPAKGQVAYVPHDWAATPS